MGENRKYMNDFSFWFPKVQNCEIKVPKTIMFKTPEELHRHFFMDNYKEDYKLIGDWVKREVMPVLEKEHMQIVFIKNAVFSNKFDASTCFVNMETLINGVVNLNYAALCVGADGFTELVVRERIRHDASRTPCIYNGLPLRTEFRVFYDFDSNKVLYTANYWDYEYVYRNLYDRTDKIILDHMRNEIETSFNTRKAEVEKLVADNMKKVQGLSGKWSVDILLSDTDNSYWLIDMAVAEQSTYWNPKLAEG